MLCNTCVHPRSRCPLLVPYATIPYITRHMCSITTLLCMLLAPKTQTETVAAATINITPVTEPVQYWFIKVLSLESHGTLPDSPRGEAGSVPEPGGVPRGKWQILKVVPVLVKRLNNTMKVLLIVSFRRLTKTFLVIVWRKKWSRPIEHIPTSWLFSNWISQSDC